jgi:hypothetical protein
LHLEELLHMASFKLDRTLSTASHIFVLVRLTKKNDGN